MAGKRLHSCAVVGCEEQVPTHLMMCGPHWAQVPNKTDVYRAWHAYKRDGRSARRQAYFHERKKAVRAVVERIVTIREAEESLEPVDIMRVLFTVDVFVSVKHVEGWSETERWAALQWADLCRRGQVMPRPYFLKRESLFAQEMVG